MTTLGFWIVIVTLSLKDGPEQQYKGQEVYPTYNDCMNAVRDLGPVTSALLNNRPGIVTARCVEEPSA